jgi:hypothetical protein
MVHFGAADIAAILPVTSEQIGAAYKDAMTEPGGRHISMNDAG